MNRAAHRNRINRALDRAIRDVEKGNMHFMHRPRPIGVRRAADRAEKKADARG